MQRSSAESLTSSKASTCYGQATKSIDYLHVIYKYCIIHYRIKYLVSTVLYSPVNMKANSKLHPKHSHSRLRSSVALPKLRKNAMTRNLSTQATHQASKRPCAHRAATAIEKVQLDLDIQKHSEILSYGLPQLRPHCDANCRFWLQESVSLIFVTWK